MIKRSNYLSYFMICISIPAFAVTTNKTNDLEAEMLIFSAAFPGMMSFNNSEASTARLSNSEFKNIVHLINHAEYKQAVPLLKEYANKQNNAWSELVLGNLYQAGIGVHQSLPLAYAYYLRSAMSGNHFAQRNIANAYLNGWGTNTDLSKVKHWYQQAIAVPQGADMLFLTSQMVSPFSKSVASQYVKKAIARLYALSATGVGTASYELGVFYQYGLGLPHDKSKAKAFYEKASAQHFAPAVHAIQALKEKNT
ncbi:tetratricopeptide repeat protein [Acidithiobacillus thiooxidans]|uniref:Sel1-repeat-containing protein YbeQ n=1 Tax=Acidithiobacillus thiooxidans ATCC 19377 TaxID=637390 RepID=A0A543Q855_ACITH|nr:tetratricopeptide repeat protein [Acidithiobacillus thiooxidans]MDX5935989.1 tetratricopeptide repeat protein [Acidithiobacillus thiooxidans]TQN52508.1 Sel1-repeat-containing protein YbeQ [Acidithiobacillus thiooxidans ATCC 19377]